MVESLLTLMFQTDITLENVVLGYKNYADYEKNPNFFGAIIGRVAGRIQDASFTIEDQTYTLEANEGSSSFTWRIMVDFIK